MTLNLTSARVIIDAALAKSGELKLAPLCVAVLDSRGCMVAFGAQNGVSLLRDQMARAKGMGALYLGIGSRAIFERAKAQPFFVDAVNSLAQGEMVPSPGGVLIRDRAGVLLGAVGISGDTGDNDEICALAGITAAGFVGETG